MTEKKYCRNCGSELKRNAKFCTSCGKPVEQENQAELNNNVISTEQKIEEVQQPVLDTPKSENNINSHKKKSGAIIGAVVGVIGIFFIAVAANNSFFIPQIMDVINGEYVAHPEDLDPGYSYPKELINLATNMPDEFKNTNLYTPYILSKLKKKQVSVLSYGVGVVSSISESRNDPDKFLDVTIDPIFDGAPIYHTSITPEETSHLNEGDTIIFWGKMYSSHGEVRDYISMYIGGWCGFDINEYVQMALEEGLPLPEGYSAPISTNVTEPVQQPDNNVAPIPTMGASANQDLPDYITGSSTQLGIQNLYNIKYYAFDDSGINMCIYDDPNAYLVKFLKNNDLIWDGEISRFQRLDNGGLGIVAEGVNAYSGTFLNISWSSVNDINNCVVNGSDDYFELNNYYSTTIPQIQPQTQVQGDKGCGYIIEGSDSRYLTKDELMGMSKDSLRRARNEIYARHGRIFKSDDLNSYFNSMDWYYPTVPADQFNEDVLNQYEKQNLITIKEVEDLKK